MPKAMATGAKSISRISMNTPQGSMIAQAHSAKAAPAPAGSAPSASTVRPARLPRAERRRRRV